MSTARWRSAIAFIIVLILLAAPGDSAIFGTVQGTIRDAEHRPLADATVTLQSQTSDWKRVSATRSDGSFSFVAVPIGEYEVRATAAGLLTSGRRIAMTSSALLDASIDLPVARASEEIRVLAAAPSVDPRSSATRTTITGAAMARTPGADRPDSMAMITEFVPGSYMVHDQLHVRGGHQVSWLIDGVPVPNTNIASNVGPQFDPRDIDTLEVQRGGMSAEYGDRTYGVFNVVPRTGFERNRDADLTLSYGTLHSTNDQLSLGSHSARFAYYGSVSANRTDAGLQTPIPRILNDDARGAAAFLQLVLLPSDVDQFRLAASGRSNEYAIPNDEEANASGVRDRQRERDLFLNGSWLRMLNGQGLVTVSPLFHQNLADFESGPVDPIRATDRRTSRYTGGQATYALARGGDDVRFGLFGFHQQDSTLFGLRSNDEALAQFERPSGSVEAVFLDERHDVNSWLTVRGGLRYTRFHGGERESAADPRIGASLRLPWQNAVIRVSYGRSYQPPPLSTVSGPLLQFALDQGFGFLPLRGERDRQSEIGVAVPVGGWTIDAAAFRTDARNFFDHDVLGNSNIFFPVTIDHVHIRGSELAVQSPNIVEHARLHVAYSHQTIEGEGGVVGGLTGFETPEGRFLLDHDQRDTASAGATIEFGPAWVGGSVSYGSGFLDGDGPAHLPSHTGIDLAGGSSWRRWAWKITAVNVANRRYLIDNSNTFGGTHYNEAREVSAQLRYRFRY